MTILSLSRNLPRKVVKARCKVPKKGHRAGQVALYGQDGHGVLVSSGFVMPLRDSISIVEPWAWLVYEENE